MGTAFKWQSTTSTRAPGMGRPMLTVGLVSSSAVHQTVASVGPYSLNNRTPGKSAWCCATSSGGHASPATMTVRNDDRCAPA